MYTKLLNFINPKYIKYIIVTLIIIIGILTYISVNNKINKLENRITELQLLVNTKELNNFRLKNSLRELKVTISNLEVDKNKALKNLEKWKNKPAKVKYKTVYKTIKEKSDDCEYLKDVLNSVRTLNVDKL